jgi:hypothetical protein
MHRGKIMNEKILGYLTDYFQMNDFFTNFYEIIFTDKRILIINSGETFRAWITRADVAYNKRQKVFNMNNIEDIYNNFKDEEIESIYFKDAEEIILTEKTFIKNGKIQIKLKDDGKKVYYTNKKNSLENFKKTFKNNTIPINVVVN